MPFDQAFNDGQGHSNYTPDQAAVHWMITPNFHGGHEMDRSNTEHDQMRYQHRGYAKYADIVRLFGWEAFNSFYHQENLDYNAGTSSSGGLDRVDSRTLRFSIAAGVDVRPLIHFWGVRQRNDAALKTAIENEGLQASDKIRCLLKRYRTIVPVTNGGFNAHYEAIYPGKPYNSNNNPLYGVGWYHVQSSTYGTAEGKAATDRIDALLQLYFPSTKGNSCPTGVESG